MAKPTKQKPEASVKAEAQPTIAPAPSTPLLESIKKFDYLDIKFQAFFVALLAFLFYINTVVNEYAHDDGIVIVKNEFVQEGFAGLEGIFTKDAYSSYYRQLNTVNQLSGGRFRPLSIASFAVEQQFFGPTPVDKVDSVLKMTSTYGVHGPAEAKLIKNMHYRHFFNVLWYMASVVALLYFLRLVVFKDNALLAFLAAIIFTIHPIHTEVVANVKSRDEIMSLLFICLTFVFAFKHQEERKPWMLGMGMLSFLLAFLSKEYAISLVVLLPMSFFLFRNYSIPKSIITFLPYAVVIGIYFFMRVKVAAGEDSTSEGGSFVDLLGKMSSSNSNSEKEILNNPYYYATDPQRLATKVSTPLYYIKLLLFPHPLSADYSYNSIPYKSFSDWQFIVSILVHGAIVGGIFFFSFFKKNLKFIGFALAFYLIHILLVNNWIFNVGATLGERLAFHSSVGFSIIVAYLIYQLYEKITPVAKAKTAVFGLMGLLIVLCGFKTTTRNLDWKNDKTLFTHDIQYSPNSVLMLGNVAAANVSASDFEKDSVKRVGYLREAIKMLNHAIDLHPGFVAGFMNKGIAHFKLGEMDSTKICMDSVKANYPNYPTLKVLSALIADHYMKIGWSRYGKFKMYPEAIAEFQKGIGLDSSNVDLWYNIGGAYYSNKQFEEAIKAWQVTLRLKPDYKEAQAGMQAAINILRQGAPPPPPPSAPGMKPAAGKPKFISAAKKK